MIPTCTPVLLARVGVRFGKRQHLRIRCRATGMSHGSVHGAVMPATSLLDAVDQRGSFRRPPNTQDHRNPVDGQVDGPRRGRRLKQQRVPCAIDAIEEDRPRKG